MSQISFIEVLGGTLVATSSVTTMKVTESSSSHRFAVLIYTATGAQWTFGLYETEDEAFGKMHALAESIGPVYSEQ